MVLISVSLHEDSQSPVRVTRGPYDVSQALGARVEERRVVPREPWARGDLISMISAPAWRPSVAKRYGVIGMKRLFVASQAAMISGTSA
jgi:hypothetical protein